MTAVLDLDRRTLTMDGATVCMSKSTARLLERIARGRGDTDVLIAALWPNPHTQPDDAQGVITVLVSRFRSACRRAGIKAPIATQYGVGYVATRQIDVVMEGAPIVIPGRFRTDLSVILSQSGLRTAPAMLALVREGM